MDKLMHTYICTHYIYIYIYTHIYIHVCVVRRSTYMGSSFRHDGTCHQLRGL